MLFAKVSFHTSDIYDWIEAVLAREGTKVIKELTSIRDGDGERTRFVLDIVTDNGDGNRGALSLGDPRVMLILAKEAKHRGYKVSALLGRLSWTDSVLDPLSGELFLELPDRINVPLS